MNLIALAAVLRARATLAMRERWTREERWRAFAPSRWTGHRSTASSTAGSGRRPWRIFRF